MRAIDRIEKAIQEKQPDVTRIFIEAESIKQAEADQHDEPQGAPAAARASAAAERRAAQRE